MPNTVRGLAVAGLGVLIGIVVSAVLYAIVVGLLSSVSGGESDVPLWRRSWQFGTTFGLLAGANLGLTAAGLAIGKEPDAMRAVRIALLLVGVLAVVLVFTGGRWNSMIGAGGGPILVLVIVWMIATHLLTKAAQAALR